MQVLLGGLGGGGGGFICQNAVGLTDFGNSAGLQPSAKLMLRMIIRRVMIQICYKRYDVRSVRLM